jgi:hypothetical protein
VLLLDDELGPTVRGWMSTKAAATSELIQRPPTPAFRAKQQ